MCATRSGVLNLGRPFKAGSRPSTDGRRVSDDRISPTSNARRNQRRVSLTTPNTPAEKSSFGDVHVGSLRSYDVTQLRLADREPSVAVLPLKPTQLRELLVNPLRRISF